MSLDFVLTTRYRNRTIGTDGTMSVTQNTTSNAANTARKFSPKFSPYSSDPSAKPSSWKPDHLAVLIHGLWGNPSHLDFCTSSLRAAFPDNKLKILVAKSNAGNFTYDGIELGAERVVSEIEHELEDCQEKGIKITRISLVGYSLGGLVARYVIGLLEAKGLFEKIAPVVCISSLFVVVFGQVREVTDHSTAAELYNFCDTSSRGQDSPSRYS
jgi:pimeloyl-ACP methyl ester carboxylesterase